MCFVEGGSCDAELSNKICNKFLKYEVFVSRYGCILIKIKNIYKHTAVHIKTEKKEKNTLIYKIK